jgi:hypothetical protein
MQSALQDFLAALVSERLSAPERVVAAIWFHGTTGSNGEGSLREILAEIEQAGYGQQNATRIAHSLSRDQRLVKGKSGFRIRATSKPDLDGRFLAFLAQRPIPVSSSVVPMELFRGRWSYVERVVIQLNASYDGSLYDCSAVMCRRLIETLMIEVFEMLGRAAEIKAPDGHFLMLAALAEVAARDSGLNLGRNSKHALKSLKELGDLAAHNRRFNARKGDIDDIKSGLRIVVEELLNIWDEARRTRKENGK